MTMTAMMVAGTVISAVGQIRAGQAQKAMYKAQARQAEIQGRSQAIRARQEALAYREEGIKSLENTRKNLATINARGAAGALDPFSGSVGNIMSVNLSEGVSDFYAALDNVAMGRANEEIARGADKVGLAQERQRLLDQEILSEVARKAGGCQAQKRDKTHQ